MKDNLAYDFTKLLALLFIALKLTDHLSWSWWWILSPIWIGAIFLFLAGVVKEAFGGDWDGEDS